MLFKAIKNIIKLSYFYYIITLALNFNIYLLSKLIYILKCLYNNNSKTKIC